MEWSTLATRLIAPALLAVVTVDIIRRILRNRIERKGYPLPPGPFPFPLLGSALSLNAKEPWLTFVEWRAKYGDIMYIRLLDTDVIVLSSISDALALLEKRSRLYSDRPFIATAVPYGHDVNFALARYGEHWRLCRRIFQQTFRADAALNFRPMQLRRARQLIVNLTDDPDKYPSHFATFATAIALSAAYDYDPSPRDDPIVSIIDDYLKASLPGLAPGKMVLLKALPFLLHIPDWLPGSWIKREAEEAYAWRNKMVETPYRHVQECIESKDHLNPSMVSDHIARMENFDSSYRSKYETALQQASVTAFIGSAESTTSILLMFTLAMIENPHVWKRAQAEIDALVGTDRLPEFDDRVSLPYLDAIIREVFRWGIIVPLGAPHAVTLDDVYKGYYIPKGATIFVNVWAISRDKARYPDGDKFIPERFLNAAGILIDDDPSDFIFGFGRRRCPGRYAADASIWSAIATMLATLDFNLAKDADGNNIMFKATFATTMTMYVRLVPVTTQIRSPVDSPLARMFAEKCLIMYSLSDVGDVRW
ncbi:cytochrome P450 [Imleria badia]|nr:cytochrome P450 [Imleria badia]